MAALTAERLRQVLKYCPRTGEFRWRESTSLKIKPGQLAGCETVGRRRIRVDGVLYLANRLAWFYMTSEWPAMQVDHKNNNGLDDRWENLRLATHAENMRNCRRKKKRGLKGTSQDSRTGNWTAQICKDRSSIHLGTFKTEQDAHEAYCLAAKKLHGEFARAG